MAIVRGITTTLSIDLQGDRLRRVLPDSEVYVVVTLQQDEICISKYRDELEITVEQKTANEDHGDQVVSAIWDEATNIRCHLTAEETQRFRVGGVQFQLKWKDSDGNVCGSKICQIPVGGSLREERPKEKRDVRH